MSRGPTTNHRRNAGWLLVAGLGWATLAWAGQVAAATDELDASAEATVRTPIDEGYIDWTRGKLVITASSDRTMGAWRSRRVQGVKRRNRHRRSSAGAAVS